MACDKKLPAFRCKVPKLMTWRCSAETRDECTVDVQRMVRLDDFKWLGVQPCPGTMLQWSASVREITDCMRGRPYGMRKVPAVALLEAVGYIPATCITFTIFITMTVRIALFRSC